MQQRSGPSTGYMHRAYAESLAEFGTPRALPESGGWLLERPIAGSDARDAMGCYPLFACRDWQMLGRDLDAVGGDLVSLVFVADPFGNCTRADLERVFPDRLLHFKDHFVVQLGAASAAAIATNHRRNAKQALKALTVEVAETTAALAGEWSALYANLVARHGIGGIATFSPRSLALQLEVPGSTLFVARHEGETVGMVLFYRQDDVVYYHLAAYSDRGYELRASFALFSRAIEHFADAGLKWLSLGAGVGLASDADDGLSRFKRGWATGTKPAYLCGRIFDRDGYRRIAEASGKAETAYFPAYRAGEFG